MEKKAVKKLQAEMRKFKEKRLELKKKIIYERQRAKQFEEYSNTLKQKLNKKNV